MKKHNFIPSFNLITALVFSISVICISSFSYAQNMNLHQSETAKKIAERKKILGASGVNNQGMDNISFQSLQNGNSAMPQEDLLRQRELIKDINDRQANHQMSGNILQLPEKVAALPDTVMFTPDTYKDIVAAIEAGPFTRKGEYNPTAKPISIFGTRNIYVSAIVYNDAKNWTAWINNLKIKPDFSDPVVKIVDVSKDNIDLFIKGDSATDDKIIRLRTNQTYMPGSNKVIEGIVP